MIAFTAGGINFRMHILVVLMGALTVCFGMTEELGWVTAALFVHESAHIVAAHICGAEIDHIEIMPFGGAAHIKGLYSVDGIVLSLTALAGPAANGVFMLSAAAAGWWGAIGYGTVENIIMINAALMFFNLLPALPLDGGRVMYAALRAALGRKIAVDTTAVIAYVIAGLLAAMAVYGAVRGEKFNISLVIMAVFLAASTWDERKSALDDGVSGALRGICRERKLPSKVRLVALDAESPLSAAARYMGGREMTVFAMLRGGRILEFIGEGEAALRLMGDINRTGGSQ